MLAATPSVTARVVIEETVAYPEDPGWHRAVRILSCGLAPHVLLEKSALMVRAMTESERSDIPLG